FTGNADQAGGIPQSGDPADSGASEYLEGATGSGDYERTEETLNHEVNRIRKEIVESPYKIRDLGIQVMVEPPDSEDAGSFPEERREDIRQLLSTIVRTSINKDSGTDISDEAIQDKVVVSVQPFNGKTVMANGAKPALPWWAYVVAGLLLAVIAVLVFLMIRERRASDAEEAELEDIHQPVDIPDMNNESLSESAIRRKQLEKMAKEKPDEFAKLLRTWLAED
ncbi:MAG TPA: flagellar M-ring protein FliF C-terminal domain-containing protein, partial [Bacillaceae bacterium]